jgi:hypothetical protein
VDKINPDDIIIGDKNAILLATRLLGYGPEYKSNFYSSVLGDIVEANIDLSAIKIKEVDTSKFNNKNSFEFTTPIGKNKVTFKILTHGDEKLIDKDIEALQKINKDVSYDITTRLRHMITAVDGNSDVSHISKYINGMLARDSRAFREYVKTITPDLNMKVEYTHENGEVEEAPVSLGVGFFWPSSES